MLVQMILGALISDTIFGDSSFFRQHFPWEVSIDKPEASPSPKSWPLKGKEEFGLWASN